MFQVFMHIKLCITSVCPSRASDFSRNRKAQETSNSVKT